MNRYGVYWSSVTGKYVVFDYVYLEEHVDFDTLEEARNECDALNAEDHG